MAANIIARTTPDNRSAVFLLDTMDDKGNIKAWFPDQDEVVASNLDYYKTTKSTSDAQEIEMANKYTTKFGFGTGITIRRKLFRASHMPTKTVPKETHPESVNEQITSTEADKITLDQIEFTERLLMTIMKSLRESMKQ